MLTTVLQIEHNRILTIWAHRRPYEAQSTMDLFKTLGLFILTAIAEIAGCYLPYLWMKEGKSVWLLLPAALCLVLFVWLLTLHPYATARVYAAYGGVYVGTALAWLWAVQSVRPIPTDYLGVALCLAGMAVILLGPRTT